LKFARSANVITDICSLYADIVTYPLPGHTEDSIGVLDMRTGTLITGDGLQGAGVDKYRCGIQNLSAYLETLDRIENDSKIENVLFSHAYEPWYRDCAMGRQNVLKSVADCRYFAKPDVNS